MNARWGWALAVLAVAVGAWQWGWQGVVLAITVVVFWLLLQFSRALRVMKTAAAAPKGRVASAVMLHSRLRPGLTLMQVLPLTGSLGDRVAVADGAPADEEWFRWADDSGAAVTLRLQAGKLQDWTLERTGDAPAPAPAATPQADSRDNPT
jgi:hypothetical protein